MATQKKTSKAPKSSKKSSLANAARHILNHLGEAERENILKAFRPKAVAAKPAAKKTAAPKAKAKKPVAVKGKAKKPSKAKKSAKKMTRVSPATETAAA